MLRITADHARAAEFLIHDGVVPSNDGRGYVLRKIMRRALRHARLAGREEPFLYELTKFVADLMGPGYPELQESVGRVQRVVREEENRYQRNFAMAEREFETALEQVEDGVIPGAAAFKLYDTFGLSLDEQEELARERDLSIDRGGFGSEMEAQRSRARASWKGGAVAAASAVYQELHKELSSEFLGYETTIEPDASVLAIVIGGERGKRVEAGQEAEVVLDRTPLLRGVGRTGWRSRGFPQGRDDCGEGP